MVTANILTGRVSPGCGDARRQSVEGHASTQRRLHPNLQPPSWSGRPGLTGLKLH